MHHCIDYGPKIPSVSCCLSLQQFNEIKIHYHLEKVIPTIEMSKSIDQFEEEKGILKIFMDFDAFVYPWIPKVSTDRINIMNTKYFIALFPKNWFVEQNLKPEVVPFLTFLLTPLRLKLVNHFLRNKRSDFLENWDFSPFCRRNSKNRFLMEF